MPVNTNKLVTLEQLGNLATRTVNAIAPTFKSLSVSGNTVSFFTSTDGTGTAAATVDFPEEIFLDQAGTTLVENFAWSAATYPNSTNPNLEGKTVLVLAVKGDKETNPTTQYSFVNLEKLIDPYTASDTSLTISGYNIKVNIDSDTDNMLSLTANGLMVDGSGKIDTVASATAGNVPLLTSDGTLTNSTIVGEDILFKVSTPTAGNVPSLTSDGTLANSTVPVADIVTKVSGGTTGDIVILDSDGKIADSTYSIATNSDVTTYLDTIFPTVSSGN